MEYHSFLHVKNEKIIKCIKSCVSVSLRSYIHSYWSLAWSETTEAIAFPSPYGVIFILTLWSKPSYDYEDIMEFPSPCGVSFILM